MKIDISEAEVQIQTDDGKKELVVIRGPMSYDQFLQALDAIKTSRTIPEFFAAVTARGLSAEHAKKLPR